VEKPFGIGLVNPRKSRVRIARAGLIANPCGPPLFGVTMDLLILIGIWREDTAISPIDLCKRISSQIQSS
jgi:hypothetical protein